MIVPSTGIGILLRKTKNYWYYMYKGAVCKVRKDKVWANIDLGKLKVAYGSTLKNRRKRRKGRILDLHGFSYTEVDEKLRSFLNFVELPCKIVTGNSSKMKAIARNIIYEYGWSSYEESAQNTGTLIVIEKKEN